MTPPDVFEEKCFFIDSSTQESFQVLNRALTLKLVLALPDSSNQLFMESDASYAGIGAILLAGMASNHIL